MPPRTSTITVSQAHAERARALAKHRGLPVGATLGDLIDAAYAAEIGELPKNTLIQSGSVIFGPSDCLLSVQRTHAASLAAQIRDVVAGKPAGINLDTGDMLLMDRQGTGIIFEAISASGERKRFSMGFLDARRLADEIEADAE